MAYPLPSDKRDPNHRECMRKETAQVFRIANGESLMQEAMKAMRLAGVRPDLTERMEYFLEHHKPLLREDADSAERVHVNTVSAGPIDCALNEPLVVFPCACGAMNAAACSKRGLYGKFFVERTDGRSAPGQKHDGCEYFVLDLDHDKHAGPALEAYAASCDSEYPALAADLRAKALTVRETIGLTPRSASEASK